MTHPAWRLVRWAPRYTVLFFAYLKMTSDDCQMQLHCNLTNVMLNSLHCRCCCMRLAKLKASFSSQR